MIDTSEEGLKAAILDTLRLAQSRGNLVGTWPAQPRGAVGGGEYAAMDTAEDAQLVAAQVDAVVRNVIAWDANRPEVKLASAKTRINAVLTDLRVRPIKPYAPDEREDP